MKALVKYGIVVLIVIFSFGLGCFFCGGFVRYPDPKLMKLKVYKGYYGEDIIEVESMYYNGVDLMNHGPSIKINVNSMDKEIDIYDRGSVIESYRESIRN